MASVGLATLSITLFLLDTPTAQVRAPRGLPSGWTIRNAKMQCQMLVSPQTARVIGTL